MSASLCIDLAAMGAVVLAFAVRFVAQPILAGRLFQLRLARLRGDLTRRASQGSCQASGRLLTWVDDLQRSPDSAARRFVDAAPPPHQDVDEVLRVQLVDAVRDFVADRALFPHSRVNTRVVLSRARAWKLAEVTLLEPDLPPPTANGPALPASAKPWTAPAASPQHIESTAVTVDLPSDSRAHTAGGDR